MTVPLLATKLYIPPPRPNLVPRLRLVERLNEGLHQRRRLTLISAPAGFGKTTLVTSWLSDSRSSFGDGDRVVNQVAWLSLDSGDNDPFRFWRYVVAALQTLDPAIGEEVLAALGSPQPPPLESVVTALTNSIVAIAQPDTVVPYILVLDDYHAIEAELIHESLSFWLDHLPPMVHLVLTTRSDPLLNLSRRRGRAQMTEVRASDLRFTVDEATEFLNRMMALDLAAEDIALLEQRTEGWIVGLQMAAVSMQGLDDRHAFVSAFVGEDRYVADYLVEEVLQHQPEHLQEFLLQTSILSALNGSLCDALTGRSGSQEILTELEQANLFLVPLDNRRDWYRYHHLFGDLLRRRLDQAQGEHIVELHRQASVWYEQQDMVDQVIHHSLAAQDFERVAALLEQRGEEIDWEYGHMRLLGWMDELPDEIVRARPGLCLVAAETLHLLGQLDAVGPYLQSVEEYLRDVGFDLSTGAVESSEASPEKLAEAQRLMGQLLSLRALITLMQGNPAEAIEQFQQTLALLPNDEEQVRGGIAIGLAEAYFLEGNVPFATQTYSKVVKVGHDRDDMIAVIALMRLAQLQALSGHLRQAAATYRQIRQLLVEEEGVHLYAGGMVNYGLGDLSREWNDLDAAARQLQLGLERGLRWAEPRLMLACYTSLARVYQAQGDGAGALGAIGEAIEVERGHNVTWAWGLPLPSAYQPRLWLAQGDLESASRWVQEQTLDVADEIQFSHEIEALTLARVLIGQSNTEAALELLARVQRGAEAGGRTGRVFEAQMLQALALQSQGDIDSALGVLSEALKLAEPGGYVRLFVDEGPSMARLLYRVVEQGRAAEYAGRLLSVFEPVEKLKSSEVEPLIEPLSERETEVLRLVADGLTNREIGQKLSISLGTVKAHTASIYGKLAVHSRTQAVARARVLGLL